MHDRQVRGLRRWPWLAAAEVSVLAALLWLVLWVVRLTVRLEKLDSGELERRWSEGEPVVMAFWHGRAAMLPFFYGGRGVFIMNSTHRDGEIVTRALARFGVHSTRGSSSRGGIGGLLGLVRAARRGHDVALIPDGPRGPAEQAKGGAVELARQTGAPLFPLAVSCSKAVRLTGWDRMIIPLPGARVVLAVGEPILAGEGEGAGGSVGGRTDREALRVELERRLVALTERADRASGLAAAGVAG